MAIRQREMETRKKLLENPVKLKEIHRLLRTDGKLATKHKDHEDGSAKKSKSKKSKKSSKKSKKSKKKKNRRHSHSSSNDDDDNSASENEADLDAILAKKYKQLQGEDDGSNMDIDKLLKVKYNKLSEELDKMGGSHSKSNKKKKKKKKDRKEEEEDDELERPIAPVPVVPVRKHVNPFSKKSDPLRGDILDEPPINRRDFAGRGPPNTTFRDQSPQTNRQVRSPIRQKPRPISRSPNRTATRNRSPLSRGSRHSSSRDHHKRRSSSRDQFNRSKDLKRRFSPPPPRKESPKANRNKSPPESRSRYSPPVAHNRRHRSPIPQQRNRSPLPFNRLTSTNSQDNQNRYLGRKLTSQERRARSPSPTHRRRRRSSSKPRTLKKRRSSSSADLSPDRKTKKTEQKKNREDKSPAAPIDKFKTVSSKQPVVVNRSCSRSASSSSSSASSSASSESTNTTDSEAEAAKRAVIASRNYGLVTAGGEKIEIKPTTETTNRHDPNKKLISSRKPSSAQVRSSERPVKLSEEEKAKRLAEMQSNAEWRDDERRRNVSKYREEEKREKAERSKETFDRDYINKELHKAMVNQNSVESRLRANKNNIQRSSGAMDSNFAKR